MFKIELGFEIGMYDPDLLSYTVFVLKGFRESSETASAADILGRYLTKLTSMISSSPVPIAMELHTQGVIPFEVFDRVQSTSAPSLDHATVIMTAVYKKVQAEGDEALGTFLEVLKWRPECSILAISIERQRQSRGSCRWSKYY